MAKKVNELAHSWTCKKIPGFHKNAFFKYQCECQKIPKHDLIKYKTAFQCQIQDVNAMQGNPSRRPFTIELHSYDILAASLYFFNLYQVFMAISYWRNAHTALH